MILQAEDISYGYPGTGLVLDGFGIALHSGERLGLAAPSGFGKTTLCRILAGYERPLSGRVLLDGQPLPAKGYCPVQMIWQHPELVINPRMRMRDVLAEGDGVDSGLINRLGIEQDWLNRFPGELSGGELQRFCIARALGGRTRFLLADEISTMLDLITQAQIWQVLLRELQQRDIGLLAISHSEPLLRQVCGDNILLDPAFIN